MQFFSYFSKVFKKLPELTEEVKEIPIELISQNPYQVRRSFDKKKLEELAKSIKANGIIQPIIVRKIEGGYELIAGERRFRASKLIGLKTIPSIVRDVDDNSMVEIAFVENIQRQQLDEFEEIENYDKLIKAYGKNNLHLLSENIGKEISEIQSKFWLLGLPKVIKRAVISRMISIEHAKILSRVKNEKIQTQLLEEIYKNRYSIEETENLVKNHVLKNGEPEKKVEDVFNSISEKKKKDFAISLKLLLELVCAFKKSGLEVSLNEKRNNEKFDITLSFHLK